MGAKEELLRLAQQRREAEAEAKRRDVTRLATTNLEKAVAAHAMDKDYEDPWTFVKDVTEHGCESGMVPGLVYYSDCVSFYNEHTDDIWNILEEDRENTGDQTILGMLAGMRWASNVGSHEQLLNYLAWYGYETAARRLLDKHEQEGENPDESA